MQLMKGWRGRYLHALRWKSSQGLGLNWLLYPRGGDDPRCMNGCGPGRGRGVRRLMRGYGTWWRWLVVTVESRSERHSLSIQVCLYGMLFLWCVNPSRSSLHAVTGFGEWSSQRMILYQWWKTRSVSGEMPYSSFRSIKESFVKVGS